MKRHYDFSNAKKNPYAKRLERSVTIRLDDSTVEYFTALAEETELPYQTLINLYLRDCAARCLDWMMCARASWPGGASHSACTGGAPFGVILGGAIARFVLSRSPDG